MTHRHSHCPQRWVSRFFGAGSGSGPGTGVCSELHPPHPLLGNLYKHHLPRDHPSRPLFLARPVCPPQTPSGMPHPPRAHKYHFAVLNCEDAPKWSHHETAIWEKLYSISPGTCAAAVQHCFPSVPLPDDCSWRHFRCFAGELPSREEVDLMDAVCVTGR